MDVRMRRTDGVTATRSLASTAEAPPILMFTTFGDDDVLWGALDAGAAGFILKDSSAEDLIAAGRAVAGGAAWLDGGLVTVRFRVPRWTTKSLCPVRR
ncbi:MAG: response regulator [Acidimicrobiales bacterium]